MGEGGREGGSEGGREGESQSYLYNSEPCT